MRIKHLFLAASALLAGCAGTTARESAPAPVTVKLIAFNDFHGNLLPPRLAIDAPGAAAGEKVAVPAGGAAWLASAISDLRAQNPNHLVISAGDMIGASPLVSALFLDEPTIAAMNLIGVDFNAVGNHEFDRGRVELLRMQKGGCEKNTPRQPCAVEPFAGARFNFLAANTLTQGGGTLFPGYMVRSFGSGRSEVKVAVIGMTLKETSTLVTPAGLVGISFADEAETANALIPRLKAEGVDAIVVLIHQGIYTQGSFNDKSCPGLEGDLTKILDRLDPAVDLVVSGHTHQAYVCDYGRINAERPILLTSAGRYGTLVTDIELAIDPAAGKVVGKKADNIIVQSEGFTGGRGAVATTDLYPRRAPDPAVAALVERYATAATPVAARRVGHFTAPALREASSAGEQVLGNLIADAQLTATRAPDKGGAQVAFMNTTGVRADIVPGPDGAVSFGQLFASQPFGNLLVVMTLTGRQVRQLLEQQFASGTNTPQTPIFLAVSDTMRYSYDLSRPAGQRITDVRLNGEPVRDDASYRVVTNSFLASGGDNFTVFLEGKNIVEGPSDLDALDAYVAASSRLTPPATGRVTNLGPPRK